MQMDRNLRSRKAPFPSKTLCTIHFLTKNVLNFSVYNRWTLLFSYLLKHFMNRKLMDENIFGGEPCGETPCGSRRGLALLQPRLALISSLTPPSVSRWKLRASKAATATARREATASFFLSFLCRQEFSSAAKLGGLIRPQVVQSLGSSSPWSSSTEKKIPPSKYFLRNVIPLLCNLITVMIAWCCTWSLG